MMQPVFEAVRRMEEAPEALEAIEALRALHVSLAEIERVLVHRARAQGTTWGAIGNALGGLTKQSAWERHHAGAPAAPSAGEVEPLRQVGAWFAWERHRACLPPLVARTRAVWAWDPRTHERRWVLPTEALYDTVSQKWAPPGAFQAS